MPIKDTEVGGNKLVPAGGFPQFCYCPVLGDLEQCFLAEFTDMDAFLLVKGYAVTKAPSPSMPPNPDAPWGPHADDPRLDALWNRAGRLGKDISIHVSDPGWSYHSIDPTNDGLMNGWSIHHSGVLAGC